MVDEGIRYICTYSGNCDDVEGDPKSYYWDIADCPASDNIFLND